MASHQPFRSPGAAAKRRNVILASVAAGLAIVAMIAVVAIVLILPDHDVPAGSSSASSATTTFTEPTTTAQPLTTTAAPLQGVPGLPQFKPSADIGGNCRYAPTSDQTGKPVNPPRSGQVATDPAHVAATIDTTAGVIGLQLAKNESPCTVNSFVNLAQQKFFDGSPCHRLTTSPGLSVLQCGDPKGDGTGGPGYKFADEYPTDQYPPDDPAGHQPVVYPRGTLAMANSGPNTNGSQFFLVYKDSELPPNYTVFGTIGENGLATLDKIAASGVSRGRDDGPPATAVTINSVRLG
ncbi:MAG: peptidylprolyl isomerase [Mycobacterium sp.]|uniref:peptidylprolyl isomerase n=1 Tax=Mycobacterium sp. TaxID=1785 RepID=UPI003CC6C638